MNYKQLRPITSDPRFKGELGKKVSWSTRSEWGEVIRKERIYTSVADRLRKVLPKGVEVESVIAFLDTGILTNCRKGVVLLMDRLILLDNSFSLSGTKNANILFFENLLSVELHSFSVVLRYMKEYKKGAPTRKVTLRCGKYNKDMYNFFRELLNRVGGPVFEEEVEVVPVKTLRDTISGINCVMEYPDIDMPNHKVAFICDPYHNAAHDYTLLDYFEQFNTGLCSFFHGRLPADFPKSVTEMKNRGGYRYFTMCKGFKEHSCCTYYYSADPTNRNMIVKHADILVYVMHSGMLSKREILSDVLEDYHKFASRFKHPIIFFADGYRLDDGQRKWIKNLLSDDGLLAEPDILFAHYQLLGNDALGRSNQANSIHLRVKDNIDKG